MSSWLIDIYQKDHELCRSLFIISWLGRQDSNLRMPGPKPGALPLGDDPIYRR